MKQFALKREPEFLDIRQGKRVYYGADQEWLVHRTGRIGGCGVVAAAELLAYLALQQPQYRKLYAGGDLARETFTRHMQDVYACVQPLTLGFGDKKHVLGVWPSFRLIQGMRRFGRQRGIGLSFSVIHSFRGRRALTEYLERALCFDCPVAMLIGFNKRFDGIYVTRPDGSAFQQECFGRHWVVVTEMRVTEDGDVLLKAATWGGSAELNLEDWIRGGFWPQALVRIDP